MNGERLIYLHGFYYRMLLFALVRVEYWFSFLRALWLLAVESHATSCSLLILYLLGEKMDAVFYFILFWGVGGGLNICAGAGLGLWLYYCSIATFLCVHFWFEVFVKYYEKCKYISTNFLGIFLNYCQKYFYSILFFLNVKILCGTLLQVCHHLFIFNCKSEIAKLLRWHLDKKRITTVQLYLTLFCKSNQFAVLLF